MLGEWYDIVKKIRYFTPNFSTILVVKGNCCLIMHKIVTISTKKLAFQEKIKFHFKINLLCSFVELRRNWIDSELTYVVLKIIYLFTEPQ